MKSLRKNIAGALALTALLLLAACADDAADPDADLAEADTMAAEAPRMAVAQLAPASGSNVQGTVTFTEQDDGLLVEARVMGLDEGLHGFHVHETGDCSAPDATSAGGHFAPEGDPHGAPSDPASQRHVGDFGNLEAGADGTAAYRRVDTIATLDGVNAIVGKAVIVHQEEDDLASQPSGDAGPRIACGVIEMQM